MTTRTESSDWFLRTGPEPRRASRPSLIRRFLGALDSVADFLDEVRALQDRFPSSKFPPD